MKKGALAGALRSAGWRDQPKPTMPPSMYVPLLFTALGFYLAFVAALLMQMRKPNFWPTCARPRLTMTG